jgi:hypothetical protein
LPKCRGLNKKSKGFPSEKFNHENKKVLFKGKNLAKKRLRFCQEVKV